MFGLEKIPGLEKKIERQEERIKELDAEMHVLRKEVERLRNK